MKELDFVGYDYLHVLLDCIREAEARIEAGEQPWTVYDGDPADDPKMTREGYQGLLAQIQELLTQRLDHWGQGEALHAVRTVSVVQVPSAGLARRMVVRRHGTAEPWRRVDGVVSGDGGGGIEDIIFAGDGDPKAEPVRWPFVRTEHHAFPRATPDWRITDDQFHWDDVAVIFSVPDRSGAPDARDSELIISDRLALWDVQVITQAPLAFTDGELQTIEEAA